MGTFNTAKCGEDNAVELFDQLHKVMNGVILLQEVASWSEGGEFEIEGWSIYHTSSNPSAVAVPNTLCPLVREYCAECMCCGVLIGDIAVVSTYLPEQSLLNPTSRASVL